MARFSVALLKLSSSLRRRTGLCRGNTRLGLVISIPLVVFGATLLMVLMERYPIIITLGAAVLGWTAGEMGVTDPAVLDWVKANAHWLDWIAPAVGAVLVVVVGKALAKRKEGKPEASVPATLAGPPPP